MVSMHLSTCPTFAAMSPQVKTKTIINQGECLHCSAWDHSKHKVPGTGFMGDPKCKLKVAGNDCGGKHGMWFHSQDGGAAHTGTVLETGISMAAPRPIRVNAGLETGTVLVDPGSDTNYVRHNFARALGLQGVPYAR